MRQPTSSEASPQSPDLFTLKPPLSSALSSLNVHLEEELARYRRQRQGRPVPPSQISKTIKPNRKPLDLIAVKAERATQKAAPASSSKSPPRTAATPPPPPPNPFLKKETSISQDSSDDAVVQSVSSNELGDSAGPLALATRKADSGAANTFALATHANQQTDPDDYLESSEELIRSLADRLKPKPETPPLSRFEFAWPSQLATPANVGSFLLLLVVSAGVGYVGTNPEAVNHLFGRFQSNASTSQQAVESTQSSAGPSGEGAFRPLGPDLSNQEFVELDLDALSTLPVASSQVQSQPPTLANSPSSAGATTAPSSQAAANIPATPQTPVNPTPAAQPSPPAAPPSYSATPPTAVNPRPAAPPTPTPSPTPAAVSAPAPAYTPVPSQTLPSVAAAPSVTAAAPQIVTTTPSTAAPAPVAPIPSIVAAGAGSTPVSTPRYRVVTPYTGDPSLDRVRGVVSDAFVRESQIQAGAFADEAAAQARVQELQAQGISAQVRVD